MPFVYRLQKILDFRIRKKEEQLLVVQKAQQEVYLAEQRIQENQEEIQRTIQNKKNEKDYRLMEYYDKYLHHLWDKADALEAERKRVQAILDEEKQKLIKFEQDVKVLEKHKDKQKELYLEEEKALELRQLSEIGVQRFFLQSREQAEEEAELERLLQETEYEME